jgi:hypothetical protein
VSAEMNHGHVRNLDGVVARCGGPGICPTCKEELLRFGMQEIDQLRKQVVELKKCTITQADAQELLGLKVAFMGGPSYELAQKIRLIAGKS